MIFTHHTQRIQFFKKFDIGYCLSALLQFLYAKPYESCPRCYYSYVYKFTCRTNIENQSEAYSFNSFDSRPAQVHVVQAFILFTLLHSSFFFFTSYTLKKKTPVNILNNNNKQIEKGQKHCSEIFYDANVLKRKMSKSMEFGSIIWYG